jgi:DNA processing protein
MSDAEVLARVALSRVGEPGDQNLGAWVDRVGPVAAVEDLARGRCPLRRAESYLARFARVRPHEDLEGAAAAGVRVLVPGTPGWPTQLDDLGTGAPLLLWLRGPADLRLSALCSVAVVGSRAATRYGELVASDLSATFGAEGWTVVSGGAYGIDAAAHRGALAVDATTVAVLANGADQMYPRGNDALLARVADTGLIVTELAPGEHPTRTRFLERNRVIAALSRGTVVVESAVRSGALGTASRAADLGRPVMGVPGPVTSVTSAGVHARIRDHEAVLVTSAAEVLELLRPLGANGSSTDAGSDTPQPPDPLAALPSDLRAVHDALSVRRARDLADLAVRAFVPESAVLGLLGDLQVRGLSERVPGGWRLRRGAP